MLTRQRKTLTLAFAPPPCAPHSNPDPPVIAVAFSVVFISVAYFLLRCICAGVCSGQSRVREEQGGEGVAPRGRSALSPGELVVGVYIEFHVDIAVEVPC